ncbi:type II toxin-antitoxin system HicB family antitoxin [bacterium]|nr:type II toxin-antitoxin system HicB family antitoxin [bacterium]
MKFPVAVFKDPKSDFGVIIPDLPGCFSAGDSFENAIESVKEAIECHIEGMIKDEEAIPSPKKIDVHQKNLKYKNAVWAMVEIDLSVLSDKAKIPERILASIDKFAKKQGETRSGFLARAALEFIANH